AYLYRGEIDLRASRQRHVIGEPVFFLIPPRLPYQFVVTVPDEHIWAIFDPGPRLAKLLEKLTGGVHVQPLEEIGESGDAIAEAMRQMLHWWRSEPMRVALAENSLERALLLTAELDVEDRRHEPRVAKALAFIANHWHEPMTVRQLAAHVHLSPSRFAALFRGEMGTTPAKYLEARRMEHACDLLLGSNASVAEVAEAVGYVNAFHFSTRFRAKHGQSPREFRRSPMRRRLEIVPELPETFQPES
ncbi:MAG: AraC family transcriptional regulator, partial [Phycisphaeraceae bacterium]|nr:AraC family transcriptional regulator [Phycisphaeraceae bacterium]